MVKTGLEDNRKTDCIECEDVARPIVKIADLERQEIVRALRMTKGNVSQAAKLVGLGRATMYRRLRKYLIAEKK